MKICSVVHGMFDRPEPWRETFADLRDAIGINAGTPQEAICRAREMRQEYISLAKQLEDLRGQAPVGRDPPWQEIWMDLCNAMGMDVGRPQEDVIRRIGQMRQEYISLAKQFEDLRGQVPVGRDPEPLPMILHCPWCGDRHIDRGEFATKVHHTHACQSCGEVWRPAVAPTVGVQFLPGFRDTDTDDRPRPELAPPGGVVFKAFY